MKLEQIKYIGFDLDQTLYPKSPDIDSAIQKYIYEVIAKFKNCSIEEGKDLFCAHYPVISGRKTLMRLGFPSEQAEQIIQKALENADILSFLKPNKEVLEMLTQLKKSYSLALITGSAKEIALKKMRALQLPQELFSVFITGEVIKSDGTAFLQWMSHIKKDRSEATAKEFLYVGDRKTTDVD
ncbi:MAG: HAD hydrolase-like protein, partial [Candidatus Woesearchaeota archaeon]|nr:HAD hydrolase-like protein [Candidatus Woesearchaeota archaeon]